MEDFLLGIIAINRLHLQSKDDDDSVVKQTFLCH